MIDPSYDLIISDIKIMKMEISIDICVPKITHAENSLICRWSVFASFFFRDNVYVKKISI